MDIWWQNGRFILHGKERRGIKVKKGEQREGRKMMGWTKKGEKVKKRGEGERERGMKEGPKEGGRERSKTPEPFRAKPVKER